MSHPAVEVAAHRGPRGPDGLGMCEAVLQSSCGAQIRADSRTSSQPDARNACRYRVRQVTYISLRSCRFRSARSRRQRTRSASRVEPVCVQPVSSRGSRGAPSRGVSSPPGRRRGGAWGIPARAKPRVGEDTDLDVVVPEHEQRAVRIEYGDAGGVAARGAEAALDEGCELPPVSPAVRARVHQQQPDPWVGSAGSGWWARVITIPTSRPPRKSPLRARKSRLGRGSRNAGQLSPGRTGAPRSSPVPVLPRPASQMPDAGTPGRSQGFQRSAACLRRSRRSPGRCRPGPRRSPGRPRGTSTRRRCGTARRRPSPFPWPRPPTGRSGRSRRRRPG